MSIFPQQFREAILIKDIALVKTATTKFLKDLDEIYANFNIWNDIAEEDYVLLTEIRKIYSDCKSKEENKIASDLLYLIQNIILNIECFKRDTNRFKKIKSDDVKTQEIINKKKLLITKIHNELQDILEREFAFEKLLGKEAKEITRKEMYERSETRGLATIDRGQIYLLQKIPLKYKKYVKIHEITEFRVFSMPRLIQKYNFLKSLFKYFCNCENVNSYKPGTEDHELAIYVESHVIATYEEFRVAKKEGLLTEYFRYCTKYYTSKYYDNPRGKFLSGIRNKIYTFIKHGV